ncbi:MAG TPA: hypothetical protein VIY47_06565 [Ignavibacteriaceae bacterium]
MEETVAEDIAHLSCLKKMDNIVEPEKYGVFIDTPSFMIHPYCWCDLPSCPWCGLYQDSFTKFGAMKKQKAPNFWHKPSNLKIWWYKTIGRDMESNRQFTKEEWIALIKTCQNIINNKLY